MKKVNAMKLPLRFAVSFSLAAGVILAGVAAQAAPQALGLTASLRPTPMRCDAAGCRADLSAFCLQQQRADPRPGTVYEVAPGTRVTLLVTGHDGRQTRLDGARSLSFIDDRGFVSITARLKPEALAGLNAASVAIEVGQDAALLPATTAGDRNPQGEDEAALATGANRQKAETFYDKPGRDADAIRLTNAMINELPPGARGRDDTDGHLIGQALAQYQGAPIALEGASLAETIHRNCVAKTDVTHQVDSMRSCLEGSHDILSTHVNIDFWNSLGGS
jgi:hypothetical protein